MSDDSAADPGGGWLPGDGSGGRLPGDGSGGRLPGDGSGGWLPGDGSGGRLPGDGSGGRPRRELALVLLLGAAGAGLVFLATRQGWAQVHAAAPKPLPSSVVTETGQDLVPAADALAVAALAGLAAVLATRRVLRRITGVVLAGFGAGIAVAVGTGLSTANVLAAVSGGGGQGPGGAGATAGSVSAGSVSAGSVTAGPAAGNNGLVEGFPWRVTFASFPWHGAALAGAVALIAAGVLVAWRADRLPVMSSRFDPPAPATPLTAAAARRRETAGSDTAAIWESLTRGDDPTTSGRGQRRTDEDVGGVDGGPSNEP